MQFRMTYPHARLFPDLTLGTVQPDQIVDWPSNPDPNFFEPVAVPVPVGPVVETKAASPSVSEEN